MPVRASNSSGGIEGRAAAVYFGAVKGAIPGYWMFERRAAHPPVDPVNSLLSFGYQLLYNHVATAIMAAGLNPRRGLLHEARGAHFALASDLVEEFRHIVDRVVWNLVLNAACTPDDFRHDDHGLERICLMKPDLRRRVVHEVTGRLQTQVGLDGSRMSYREAIDRQVQRLRLFMSGSQPDYDPFEGGV